ncbi:MAG: hypothetical protein HQK96_00745 [Nitrospirae bacterium]|nr:hypothetical protein [Nitrospirota bacterium]
MIEYIRNISAGNRKTIFFLSLLPVLICFMYIWYYGVNVPYWDEWDNFPLIDKVLTGNFNFSMFYDQFNEHRIVLQRVTMVILGILSSYNTKVDMYFSQITMVIMVFILFIEFKRLLGQNFMALFVPIPYLAFSLMQAVNTLYAIQAVAYYSVFFSVLTFYLISRLDYCETRGKLILQCALPIASALATSFTFTCGLMVWPVGFLQILISGIQKRLKIFMLCVWPIMGAATFLLYFSNYTHPTGSPPAMIFFKYPLQGLTYFSYLLGNILYAGRMVNLIAGIFIVLAAFLLFISIPFNKLPRYSFWIASFTYSFLAIFAIAFGRSTLDFEYLYLPIRYTTYGVVGPISLYVMYIGAVSDESSNTSIRYSKLVKCVFIVLFAVICSSIIPSYESGYSQGVFWKGHREKVAYYTYTYKMQSDENLKIVHPDPMIVRKYAPILENRKYSVFTNPYLPPLDKLTSANCTTTGFYTINAAQPNAHGQLFTIDDKQRYLSIIGWAIDDLKKDIAGGVYIKIDDKLFPALYGLDRVDVAEHLKINNYRYTGYNIEIPVSLIEKGTHKLSVLVLTNDKKHYFVPSVEVIVNRA